MSETRFTPGPWKFVRMVGAEERAAIIGKPLDEHEGYYRENNGDWIVSGPECRIASVSFKGTAKRGQGYTAPDPEGMANARLIAAAPKMHEALQSLLKEWSDVLPVPAIREIRAALALADSDEEGR